MEEPLSFHLVLSKAEILRLYVLANPAFYIRCAKAAEHDCTQEMVGPVVEAAVSCLSEKAILVSAWAGKKKASANAEVVPQLSASLKRVKHASKMPQQL